MDETDEMLNKAYALAFFIHGDEELARRIVLSAMSRLEVAVAAQDKRLYYSLKGRATSRKTRSKISLSEPHLLQRLVYVESEPFEKNKEQQDGLLDEEDLVAHFVKHLLKITLKRNSFYVTLGLGRVLHNYSTPETMEIHALAVQDPDRVGDESYYRACKGTLMKEIKERFGNLLESVKGSRGEERFQAKTDSSRYAAFIRECLGVFTPWFTHCVVPAGYNPTSDVIAPLTFAGGDPDDEHRVEVHRVHSIVHPDCFERLVKALKYESPEVKLEIPDFSIRNDKEKPPRTRRRDMSEEEKSLIESGLVEQSARRRAANAGLLRVTVDGAERAVIDLNRTDKARFEIDSSADLLEVMTTDESGELLLASHLIDLNEARSKRSIVIEGGQRIAFDIATDDDANAIVEVSYRETNPMRAAALFFKRKQLLVSDWRNRSGALRPAIVFALGVLLVTAAALIYWSMNKGASDKTQAAENQPESIAPEKREPEKQSPSETPSTPQPQQAQTPVERTPREIERSPKQAQSKLPGDKSSRGSTEIAKDTSPPQPDRVEDPDIGVDTRGGMNMRAVNSLAEVKRIYVEAKNNEAQANQFKVRFLELLNSSDRLTPTTNADQAEAALYLSKVKPEKDGLSAVVQLVNARGKVIWQARGGRRISISTASADAIVQELIKHARASKRKAKSE